MPELIRTAIAIALLVGVYHETGMWTTIFLAGIVVRFEIQQWRSE